MTLTLRRRIVGTFACISALAALATTASSSADPRPEPGPSGGGDATLNMVFVLDGLRPDSITPEDTPNLHRLRQQGVNYVNSHAAVPTVTRVNSAVIGTGAYPGTNGIVGNSMYVPEVASSPFSTGNAENLIKLDSVTGGRMVLVKTLAERLTEAGKKVVSVGSGSSGSSLLLNPRAPRGNAGVMINTGDVSAERPLAYPASVGEEIIARFGSPPTAAGEPNFNSKVDYGVRVLRDYVLPELRPDVVLNWLTEPVHSQHPYAAGSPQARETIRNDDRQIGLVLDRLSELGLRESTNIFVVSDHGFSVQNFNVNLSSELIGAGLKASASSEDVVVANSGSSLIHVKDRDPERIRAIVEFLQRQSWVDTLYTAARRPRGGQLDPADDGNGAAPPKGWVDGTFSLELIHEANAERGADIVVTYPWTDEPNTFGVPGTSAKAGSGATGPLTGTGSGHGSFSPWDIRNTFIAWGADVKDGVTMNRAPSGNVDLAPTLLALEGLDAETPDGRVLAEALNAGPTERQLKVRTRTFSTTGDRGRYHAAVQISEVDGKRYRYIDKSWRLGVRRVDLEAEGKNGDKEKEEKEKKEKMKPNN